jgi:hypothetical protein
MGYYTDYKLKIITNPNHVDEDKIFTELEEISGYGGFSHYDGELYEAKWYYHNSDMEKLSKRYPEILFQLDGVGEEKSDIWRTFFKDGKSQRTNAKITFDDFDESKLV